MNRGRRGFNRFPSQNSASHRHKFQPRTRGRFSAHGQDQNRNFRPRNPGSSGLNQHGHRPSFHHGDGEQIQHQGQRFDMTVTASRAPSSSSGHDGQQFGFSQNPPAPNSSFLASPNPAAFSNNKSLSTQSPLYHTQNVSIPVPENQNFPLGNQIASQPAQQNFYNDVIASKTQESENFFLKVQDGSQASSHIPGLDLGASDSNQIPGLDFVGPTSSSTQIPGLDVYPDTNQHQPTQEHLAPHQPVMNFLQNHPAFAQNTSIQHVHDVQNPNTSFSTSMGPPGLSQRNNFIQGNFPQQSANFQNQSANYQAPPMNRNPNLDMQGIHRGGRFPNPNDVTLNRFQSIPNQRGPQITQHNTQGYMQDINSRQQQQLWNQHEKNQAHEAGEEKSPLLIPGKEEDSHWIETWLENKRMPKEKNKTGPTSNKVATSICEAQDNIKRMMILMATLQKHVKVLETCDILDFDDQMREINRLKEEINGLRKSLSAMDKDDLQRKVKKRTSKRERLRRQREERFQEKQRQLERREQLHKEFDERQKKIEEKEKEKIQELEMKKHADKILSEVRKKTQDVSRATDLLKNLAKLRKLRKDRLQNQGLETKHASSIEFENKIEDCLEALAKQKQIYNAENRALKVMLETEHEENKEKERQIQQIQESRRQKKADKMLFGEQEHADATDPMFLFRQYYNQANTNFNSFIQIRSDWDKFCVPVGTPGGSRIPDGYVLPEAPSNDVWEAVLKDQT